MMFLAQGAEGILAMDEKKQYLLRLDNNSVIEINPSDVAINDAQIGEVWLVALHPEKPLGRLLERRTK